MPYRTASIHLNGPLGTVEVDGHDFSKATRSLTITAEAGHFPTLTLEPVIHTAEVDGNEVIVHLPDDTTALLLALGWTPPQDEQNIPT